MVYRPVRAAAKHAARGRPSRQGLARPDRVNGGDSVAMSIGVCADNKVREGGLIYFSGPREADSARRDPTLRRV